MANEPSQYYLAARGRLGDWTYLGDPWLPPSEQDLDNLKAYCLSIDADYLLLPNSRWAQRALSPGLLDRIGEAEQDWYSSVIRSTWGTESLVLYALSDEGL